MAGDDVMARLDHLESQLEEMRRELEAIRSLSVPAPATLPIEPVAVAPPETAVGVPAEPSSVAPPSPLQGAWRALERGSGSAAIDLA